MSVNWAGKHIVITGGSSGLGKKIAEGFVKRGASVIVFTLEEQLGISTKEELSHYPGSIDYIQVDITNDSDCKAAFEKLAQKFNNRVDVFINNAGRSVRGRIENTTVEDFRSLMELNFFATVRCSLLSLPYLEKTHGSIVNIGSLASKGVSRWIAAYGATKHAVAAYTQQLRLELKDKGIHAMLVCPGPVSRDNPRLYQHQHADEIPEAARKPGAGIKTSPLKVEKLVDSIILGIEKRKEEIVLPKKARILFVLNQICPKLGDWLTRKMTA